MSDPMPPPETNTEFKQFVFMWGVKPSSNRRFDFLVYVDATVEAFDVYEFNRAHAPFVGKSYDDIETFQIFEPEKCPFVPTDLARFMIRAVLPKKLNRLYRRFTEITAQDEPPPERWNRLLGQFFESIFWTQVSMRLVTPLFCGEPS
jgi:hypothetical protein